MPTMIPLGMSSEMSVERDGTAVAVSDVANRGDRRVSRQRERELCHRDSYLGAAAGSGCAGSTA